MKRKSIFSNFCLFFIRTADSVRKLGGLCVRVDSGVDVNASVSCVYQMELLTLNILGCREARGDIAMMSLSPLPVSF